LWPLYHLCPRWGGEKNGKKKAKLVDQDKDSLIEQQRKQTVNTRILTEKPYKTKEYTGQFCPCPMPSMFLSND